MTSISWSFCSGSKLVAKKDYITNQEMLGKELKLFVLKKKSVMDFWGIYCQKGLQFYYIVTTFDFSLLVSTVGHLTVNINIS